MVSTLSTLILVSHQIYAVGTPVSSPTPPISISVNSSPDYIMDILTGVYVVLTLIILMITRRSIRLGREQSQAALNESRTQSEAALEVSRQSVDGVILTLQEMQEARDQDTAPYVVAYFDINPPPLIYLVVKNLGKSVAEEITLQITPPLTSSTLQDKFSDLPFLKDGIGALVPGSETRIFFDSTIGYFDDAKNLPLRYDIVISYRGGLVSSPRSNTMVLDLSTYKGTGYFVQKNLTDLAKIVENLVRENKEIKEILANMAENLKDGIHIKNPEIFSLNLNLDIDSPLSYIIAKLKKFRENWQSAYPRLDFYLYEEVNGNMINRGANLVDPHEVNVRNECLSIGNNVSALLSIYAASIPEDQVNIIGRIALNLSTLGDVKLYRYANHNVLKFNELGNTTVKDIEDLIKLVESSR